MLCLMMKKVVLILLWCSMLSSSGLYMGCGVLLKVRVVSGM